MQIIQDHSQHSIFPKRALSYMLAESCIRLRVKQLLRIILMQDSVRDFFISIVKNIPQIKTNIMVCRKKNKENEKDVHKCVGFRNFWRIQQ